mgnify:CR=1 FL=1
MTESNLGAVYLSFNQSIIHRKSHYIGGMSSPTQFLPWWSIGFEIEAHKFNNVAIPRKVFCLRMFVLFCRHVNVGWKPSICNVCAMRTQVTEKQTFLTFYSNSNAPSFFITCLEGVI